MHHNGFMATTAAKKHQRYLMAADYLITSEESISAKKTQIGVFSDGAAPNVGRKGDKFSPRLKEPYVVGNYWN